MTKLDSSAAWKAAAAMVAQNRDVLMAIAGVFFLLPSLAFAVFVPEPQVPAGVPPAELMAAMGAAYASAAPLLIVVSILQMAGTLAMLIVMTDPARPTVGRAITRAFAATGPYLLAQLMVGVGLGVAFVVLATIASLSGIAVLAGAVVILLFAAMIYCGLRVLLVATAIAIEAERNPVAAIRRSWVLTRGNTGRLALFLLLAAILFAVVYGLVMMLVGVVLVLTTGGGVQHVLAAAVSSAITAAALVYFAAILAAVHRQLAGTTPDEVSAVFK